MGGKQQLRLKEIYHLQLVTSCIGQITLSTIFESMGWRVFRVPETATILLGGGVSFSLLDDEQRLDFQVVLRVPGVNDVKLTVHRKTC